MLAQLRAAGPLVRVRLPLFGKVWLATSYDAVNDVLRDHHRFVQSAASGGNWFMSTIMRWLPRSLRPLGTNMLSRDPPDHRRLRSLVDQAFQRQSIEKLRPRLQQLADQALVNFATEAQRSPRGVDLLAHFARPFPLAAICELLGLPPEDRPKFTQWAAGIGTTGSLFGIVRGMHGLTKLMHYLGEEIRRQSKQPREGLIAALIQAEEAGDRLSHDELLAMVFLILVAGHETTLHQIGLSVVTLLDHPQNLAELKNDWRLAEPAAQELLRYVSFAQFTKPRYAISNLEFHGQSIRRGEMVFACLASANSDPSEFQSPEQLDFQRHPNRHVAFGTGIHFCLGAKLALVEIGIALEQLFTRFPDLRLAVPREELRYSARPGSRVLLTLPVRT